MADLCTTCSIIMVVQVNEFMGDVYNPVYLFLLVDYVRRVYHCLLH